jgi:hypothetical protein
MKKLLSGIIFIGAILYITDSCSNPTPESLAKEICDCYKKAPSYANRNEKIGECIQLQLKNNERLKQMGIDKNWNYEQREDARNRFHAVLDKCDQ